MESISLSVAAKRITDGEIGIVPTDTLYGIVASVLLPDAVERVYTARKRESGKPCIVLISSISELERFGIVIDSLSKSLLDSVWPGAVSVVFPLEGEEWRHVHRDTSSVAFRVPKNAHLQEFLRESGPIIAPSANIAGEDSAQTIEEAIDFFHSDIDFVVDGGVLSGEPSTLVRISDGKWEILRQGRVIVA